MRRLLSLVTLVAVVTGAAACDAASNEGAQPRPDVTTFEQGDFDDIPLLPASEPLSAPAEENGTVARSYVVRNTSPAEVLAFYERQLSEYTVVSPPETIGQNTSRGRWELDQGRVLTVSANLERSLDGAQEFENVETLTQYSLSLAPAEG